MGILNHPVLKKVITFLIAALLLVFIGYQIWRANYKSVITETAVYASISDTIQVQGIIVRNEALLTQTTQGVITYQVADGEKIAKDSVVATIYDTSEDAVTQQRRTQLTQQLQSLQELNNSTTAYTNPDNLDKEIHTRLYTLLTALHARNETQTESGKEAVLKAINTRQIATGQVQNFNDKIQQIQDRLSALGSVKGTKRGEIITPASGFFVSTTDGYESVFDYADVTKLTVSDIKTKLEQGGASSLNGVIGKVCSAYNWYAVCIVPADTATRLKEDAQVSLQLPFVSSGSVPATVVAVNRTENAQEAAVVLQSNYMSETLARVRNETVQIQISSYTGIRISQQAVRFQTISKEVTDENGNTTTVTKDVKGVFILYGNSVKFVEIVPLYSSSDYVICATNPDKSELMTSDTLTLYDEVVIGGKDLYDGKMVK